MMRILLLLLLFALGGISNGYTQSITLSFEVTPPSCAGYSDGKAKVIAVGGIGPYTFVWSNAQQEQTIQSINAGMYTVTVSDNAGQTKVGSVLVTEPTALTADVITSFPSCNGSGGAMVVAVSGGTLPYSIIWSNGIVGPVGSGLLPGITYTATTTDAKGCQLITPVTVTEIDSLDVSIATSWAACPGINNGTATALVTPPGGLYQYNWNVSSQNTAQLTGLAGNTAVAVTVTDQNSGCTGMASGMIVWHVQLALALDNSPTVLCPDDSTGTAMAKASLGTLPYNYVWSGPEGAVYNGSNLTGLGAGTYTVTVTDGGGCTLTDSVHIGILSSLNAGFSLQQDCNNNIISFQITDNSTDTTSLITSWNWIINGVGSTGKNPPPFTVLNSSAVDIQLIVTSAVGCVDTASQHFVARAFPDVTVQTPEFTCDGSAVPVTVTGDANLNYAWIPPDGITFNPDSRHVLANPATTTLYALLVSDTTCFDTIKSIKIIRQPLPFLEAADTSVCATTATLSANTNLPSVIWTAVATGDTINPANVPAGFYIVTASDSLCVLTDTVRVQTNTLSTIDCSVVQQPSCGLNNGIITVTASGCTPPYTYLWNTADTTQTVSNLGPGTYTVTVTSADGFTATCSLVLNPSSGPTAVCNAVQQPTCGLNNGIVSVTASGGTAPYTYLWNTNDTTQTVTGLGGGTYTVTVTDANGCTATCSVTLTPSGGLTPVCNADQQPSCGLNNGSVSITPGGGTAPYTYLWNTNDTTQTVTGLGGGTYTVTVTDANGCTGTCSVTLTPISGVTANCSVVQQPSCGLNNGIITVTASGCTPPYTYLWNTADTTQTVSNLGPGTYTVTVTSADGFTATCSLVLNPSSGPVAVCNAVQQPTCGLNNGIVSVTASGGTAPYTYLWNTNDTTQTVTGLGGGTYTVTVTDANGCTATCSVTLTPSGGLTPVCNADQQPSCGLNNGSVSITPGGGTSPYTYLWNTNDTTQTVTGLGGGTYTVTVTDANGCTGTCSVTLTPISGVTANCSVVQQPSCGLNNGIITVTASGCTPPYTYLWNTADTTQTVSNLGPGTYTVTVTSADGFTATCSLVLNPSSGPTAVCNAVQQPTCGLNNGIVSVTASGGTAPYTYGWNTNDTTQTVTGLGGGTYTVTVTDANNCTATCSVTLTPSGGLTPVCNADQQPSCGLNNGSVSITPGGGTGPYTYLWNTNDTTQTVTGLGGGTYTVTVTDANGCTGTCSVTLTPISGVTANCSVVQQPSCGLNNGIITVTASGCTPPYTYLWNTADTTQTVSNLGPGTYTVTVTSADGFTATCSLVLNPSSGPTAVCNAVQQPTCGLNNGIVSVTASGGTAPYTYGWNTNDTTQTVTGLGGGTYTVTVTDANNCTATCSVTLTPSGGLTPVCNADQQPSCGLNNGSVSITPGGGTGPYTYLWNTNDTTQTVTGLGGGTYTVTVTDANGCTGTCSVTLTPISGVTANCSVVQQPSCGLNNGIITVTASGCTPPYTYLWNTADTTQTVSNLGPGTYTVTVTSADGFTATCSLVLNPSSGSVAVCNAVQQPTCGLNNGIVSVTASGGTAPYNYLWNTNDTTQTVTGLGGGTYTVTVTDANGCTATCSVTLTPSGGLTPVCNADQQPSCGLNNGSVSITPGGGTGPYTYLWNTNDTTQTVTGLGGGTYTVTVTDANGCTGTCSVTLTPISGVTANCSVVQQPSCGLNNGIITVTASGCTPPYTYLWNTTDTTQTVSNLGPGTYTVTVTSADGFTATCSLVLNPSSGPTAVCNAVQQPTCGLNNGIVSVTASGGTAPYTYLWNTNDTTQTVTGLGGGIYTVTVTDANGCTATCSVTLTPSGGLTPVCNADQQPSCGLNNGSVSITPGGGTGPYTYLWNTNDTTQTVTGLGGGTYTVTVTDANGCTGTCSVTLTPISGVTANCSVVQQPSCGLNNGIITVTASGCTPPYTYLWNTADTTQTVSNLGPGTYTVTVTSADGFTATCSLVLNPSSGPTAVCNAVQQPTCGLNNGIVSVTASGGTAPYTYLWNTNDTTQTVTGLGGGIYTVTVTDANGCTATCSVTLTPSGGLTPVCNADQQPSCGLNNGSVSITPGGGTGPYTYLWNTNDTTQTVTGLGGGTYTVTVTGANGCTGTCSVTLTPISGVTANCSVVQQPSCGLNNGIITVTASGCTPPYTYLWNTADTTQTVSNLGPGTYTVTVTSADGFTATCSLVLNPSSGPTAVCNAVQQPTCGLNNGIVSVTASGGTAPYTYLWNTNDTTQTVTGLGGGTYTVTVTDANGCTATCSVTLTPVEGVIANCSVLQPLTSCISDNGSVTVTPVGVGPFTFIWSTEDTTQTVTGLGAGIYTVTVTDGNGCTDTCSVALLPPPPVTANASSNSPVCEGSALLLSSNAITGTAPYTFSWSGPDGFQSAEQNPARTNVILTMGGTYTVTITDANGCTGTASTTVTVYPAPTATASSNGPICTGEALELTSTGAAGTPPYTYSWAGPAGFTSVEQNPTRPEASTAMGGTYTVTITDGNGCTGTATIAVTVHPAPAIAASSNSPVCEGDTIELFSNPTNGTGPFTINWTGPNGFLSTDQNPIIPNATEGMSGAYMVRVSDVNGCSDSMMVTVLVAPVSANGLVPAMACADGELSLEALNLNPGDAVLWSAEPAALDIDEPTAPSTTASGPGGQYTVSLQVTNMAGCVADTSFTVTIIAVNVAVEVTGKDTICSGESTPLLATASGTATEYTYSWSPTGSLDNSNIPNPMASPDGQETYTVTVTGDNLCTATGSVTVYFMETQCRDPYIFVPKAFTPNADNNNDRFRVRGANITELLFIVYDRWGEEVYRTEDPEHAGWDGTYRGEPSTPDSYGWYLRVRCGDGQIFENKGNVTLFK